MRPCVLGGSVLARQAPRPTSPSAHESVCRIHSCVPVCLCAVLVPLSAVRCGRGSLPARPCALVAIAAASAAASRASLTVLLMLPCAAAAAQFYPLGCRERGLAPSPQPCTEAGLAAPAPPYCEIRRGLRAITTLRAASQHRTRSCLLTAVHAAHAVVSAAATAAVADAPAAAGRYSVLAHGHYRRCSSWVFPCCCWRTACDLRGCARSTGAKLCARWSPRSADSGRGVERVAFGTDRHAQQRLWPKGRREHGQLQHPVSRQQPLAVHHGRICGHDVLGVGAAVPASATVAVPSRGGSAGGGGSGGKHRDEGAEHVCTVSFSQRHRCSWP